MTGRALTIDITTRDQQTLAALKRIQSELGKVDSKTKDTAKSSSGLSSALKGVAVGAGLKVAIGEYEDAAKVARQTEAAIRSTGNAAQVSEKQQDDMANSLSKIAAVDDEVISSGANLLRTFTSIRGEAFEPTLEAALNMSAVLGTDLPSNVQLLGKALNDPEKGLTRLTRAGVVFTDQQKEQIKTLQESGDTLGAQKVILAELETEFGGQAAAAATSSERMKVALGNAAEAAGGVLAPAFEQVATVTVAAAEAFEKLPQPLQGVVLAGAGAALVGPRIVEGFARVGESVQTVKGWGSSLKGAGDAAEGLEGSAAGAAGGASKLGLAMGAIGAAGAGVALYEASKAANQFTFDAEKAAQATDEELVANLSKLAQIDPDILKKIDLETLYRLRDITAETGQKIPGLTDAISELEGKEKQGAKTHAEYGAKVDEVKASAEGAKDSIGGLGGGFDDLAGAVGDVADELDAQTDALAENEKQIRDASSAALDAFDAEQGYEDSLSGVTDAVKKLNEARAAGASASEISAKERDLSAAIRDQAVAEGERVAKQYEANGVTLTAAQVAGIQRDEMDKARATTGYWSNDLQELRDRLDAAANSVANLAAELVGLALQQAASGLGDSFAKAFFPGRASGGPVRAGTTYRVNESGDEYFAPTVDGRIYPSRTAFEQAVADRDAYRRGGSGAGGQVVINVTTPAAVDPEAAGRAAGRAAARELRLVGKL